MRRTDALPVHDSRATKAESLVEAIRSAHERMSQRELSSTVRTALVEQSNRMVDCLIALETR